MIRRQLLILFAVVALFAAACGSDDDDDDVSAGSDPAEQDAAEEGEAEGEPTVAVADNELGSILVGAGHMTLYLFANDADGTSRCTGSCAEVWPALTVEGEPTAGEGVDQDKLGTIERDDGTTQVTYAGHPLYFYGPDERPGDVKGQGTNDVWWVVSPEGEAIREAAPTGVGGY